MGKGMPVGNEAALAAVQKASTIAVGSGQVTETWPKFLSIPTFVMSPTGSEAGRKEAVDIKKKVMTSCRKI